LVKSGGKHYTAALAEASNKVAYLNIAVYSHRKTERYYIHALKVKQLLTQKDPIVYFLFLERICKKLGLFWKENGDDAYGNLILQQAERIQSMIQNKKYADDKEEYHALDYAFYEQPIDKSLIESLLQESLHHYKVLADENPEAYEPSLAQAYDVTGTFYTQIGEKQKAERNYAEAIAIRKRLVNREQAMKSDLAASYSNLSKHYVIWNQNERAEKYALQTIDIYKSLTQGEAGAFRTDLARNYFALADFYEKIGENKKAEEYYKDSIMLYIKLFEKSSRAYIDRIINTVNNVITLFDPIGSTKWMEEFVDEGKVTEWLKNMGY
jgi:tetratricopeptide (TPR) repeat protein